MASPTADPAAEVPARPLRTTYFWLFHMFPLRRVLPALVLANVAALVALVYDLAPLVAAAIGVAVALVLLVPVRGHSVAAYADERITFAWQVFRHRSTRVNHAPFDVPVPDGGSYGMRWDGTHVITILRIDPPPRFVTRLSATGLSTGEKVPLAELARCLEQFDIELSSVDVISTGSRTSDSGPVARLYDQILGPLPAVAHRTVWVVLRLDPLANAAAVDRRGGGSTGALRSAIVATRRVANRLSARGLTASVLSSAEMNAVVHHLTRGAGLDEFTESPRAVEYDGVHCATYRVDVDALGPRGFTDVWSTPSLATTVTMRLRKAPVDPMRPRATTERGSAGPLITVSATARFDTRHEAAEVRLPGLVPLPGRQYRALLHTLPIDTSEPPLHEEGALGDADALTELTSPIGGCGQLIGADDSGQGVALPLVGQQVRRVEIVGRLLIAKQVILRAIALGSTVVVHTNRHEEWREMVAYVNAPQSLSLAAWSAGSQQANAHRSASVIVYDGVPVSQHHSDATVILLRSHEGGPSGFDRDVTLTEDVDTANRVTVVTALGSTTVNMVATPFEMTYLGAPHPVPA